MDFPKVEVVHYYGCACAGGRTRALLSSKRSTPTRRPEVTDPTCPGTCSVRSGKMGTNQQHCWNTGLKAPQGRLTLTPMTKHIP